ncbi:hypothetical protein GGI04_003180 [Coemansia thaxteri]|uniref:Thioredoxin domain-containing protein n=1 Tax=Coemansia thaxteri TaxID=2663907 RepID=A0A9W8BEF3_9FUNG|nr:hypothetical protein GGI04_003180 [Coemansia thaxteri]KAJ2004427.1 hypothetical protein H4R26_002523 [Coemansia thaxteri]KAJ2466661.1 hypothetical protein GGI02_004301 [Coemansia sp. RSA 2322]KAJ2485137.1 hypothetical protein EV174_001920 [Coemansia sp. RSA 2320]
MPIVYVNSLQELFDLIATGVKLVVDFKAAWCEPCKMMAPLFQRLAQEHADVSFVTVDMDEVPEIAREFSIMSMPTFKLFAKGDAVDEVVGANTYLLETSVRRLAG